MADLTHSLHEQLGGRYTILHEIGRGGMATVYLARDPRHDRNVALKVLDPELGAVLGAERFLAEIRVTANLQHPNLLPLFDSGTAGGFLFYVMPYVEGESLRRRLDRERQLPVDEAVAIAAGIARALAYAHARGVIHRDLKPENVLLQSGQPLVADFGIALAVSNAGGTRITQTGLSLGTPQYMSPEQATGDRAIDARSDIYALGAVLYEMLTGEPPHTAATVQATIAKVLTDTPRSVRLARPGVPPHVEAAIERALEKVPADRFATADRFADALEGKIEIAPKTAMRRSEPASRARSWQRTLVMLLPWALAAGLLALQLRPGDASPAGAPLVRSIIPTDELESPEGITITPDGRHVVFTAMSTGERYLFVRSLDALAPRQLAGTAGAEDPFLSPDSRWIGFFVGNRMKRIALAGGAVEDISSAGPGGFRSAVWTTGDEIIVNTGAEFIRMSARGGAPDTIRSDSGAIVRGAYQRITPDGEHLFFMRGGPEGPEDDFLSVVNVRTGRVQVSSIPTQTVVGTLAGHVLFRRDDDALMAVRYDARNGTIAGEPVQVLESGREFSVSDNGTVVYRADSRMRNLLARAGDSTRTLWTVPWPAPHTPRLSPDGRFLALGRRGELWVHDLATATPTRIAEFGHAAQWSADGRHVLYLYQPLPGMRPTHEVRWRVRDGSEPESTLYRSDSVAIQSAVRAADGTLYMSLGRNRRGIWKVRPGDSALVMVVDEGTQPVLSPDGRWLAYTSSESGAPEVYVRPISGAVARLAVSSQGGSQPVWDRTGRGLFYLAGNGYMRAIIETTPSLRVLRRELVLSGSGAAGASTPQYDVAADGQRLLVLEPPPGGARIVLVQNFLAELRARVSQGAKGAR